MSEPVVTTLYAQLIDHLGMPASERVAFDAHSDPGGYVFSPVKELQLKATTAGVVEIQFFRTMEATDPIMMRTTPGPIVAGDTMRLSPLLGPLPVTEPASPTPDEIDRVAKALFEPFRHGHGAGAGIWVEGEFWAYEEALVLVVDGRVDLRALAAAAIKAVRGLGGKGG